MTVSMTWLTFSSSRPRADSFSLSSSIILCVDLFRGKYREQGSNLHAQRAPDPKSGVSTNSTIPATGRRVGGVFGVGNGIS